jgi:hypothetical protein
LTEQEAQVAARAEHQAQNPPGYSLSNHHPGVSTAAGPSSAFSFNGGTQGAPPQRRPAMQPQGLVGMGGMGGSMRPPGKSGLTFDHILSRLQGELQKSRETGTELHSLTNSMGEIHETLGGSIVCIFPSLYYFMLDFFSPLIFHHILKVYLRLCLHSNILPNHRLLRYRTPLSVNSNPNYMKLNLL